MNTQYRIIIALFIFAILLITANIIVGKMFNTENKILPPAPLSFVEIDSLFKLGLQNFGLPLTIVKPAKISDVKIDKEYPSYSLKLPADLSIPVFLSELNIVFNNSDIEITSVEKKISGRTLVKIFSEEELKLAAYIEYSEDMIRKNESAGFLISINDKTDKSAIDDLFNTLEPFAFLFTPSTVMASFVRSNEKSIREYALLLGDETTDLDFKFEPGYSERRLKSSYRNLMGAFLSASFIVIDDNSSFYNSGIYPYVEKLFKEKNIKLVMKSELKILAAKVKEPSDHFAEIVSSLAEDESALIACQPDDFKLIISRMRDFRKIGYKYYLPSEIVFRQ